MTMKKKKQLLCEDNLRHNEYYGMQNTIDNLYQASLNGEVFTDLMSVMMACSVVTGHVTAILCHSGAELFDNDLYSAFTRKTFLPENRKSDFFFHYFSPTVIP